MLPPIKPRKSNKQTKAEKQKKKPKDTVPDEFFERDLLGNMNKTRTQEIANDIKNYQIKKDYVDSPSQSDEYFKSNMLNSSNSRRFGNSSEYLRIDRHNSSLNRTKLRNSLSGTHSTLSKFKIV